MRTIGLAEEILKKMVERLLSRTAFGKRLAEHSIWEQRIAEARTSLEMTRLLCLKAADVMDKLGAKAAQAEIAMIKVAGPHMALKIADDAIQAHGGAGVADDRSEEHTSDLQSLMRTPYAVFCLKKKTKTKYQKQPKIYEQPSAE